MMQTCDWIKKFIPAFSVSLLSCSKMISINEDNAIISHAIRKTMEFCKEQMLTRLAWTKYKADTMNRQDWLFETGKLSYTANHRRRR